MLTQVSVASPSVQFMAAADPKDGVISLLVVQLEVEGEISLQPSLSSPLSGPHIIGLSTAQHAMLCWHERQRQRQRRQRCSRS